MKKTFLFLLITISLIVTSLFLTSCSPQEDLVGEAGRQPIPKVEIEKPVYLEATNFRTIPRIPELTEYYNKELNYLGNLDPFPTKSLLPYWKLKMFGIVDSKEANLWSFYLQEGPMTEKTNVIQQNADNIAYGVTPEETVKNILNWIHVKSGMKIPPNCDQEQKEALSYDFIKENYPNQIIRSRTATDIILSKCFTGCTDYALVFASLARAKNVPATLTETIREKWVTEMVWNNKFNNHMEGHFFSEVYLSNLNKWVVINPAGNEFTGRDSDGYYPDIPPEETEEKRYLLFERGLDHYDYGVKSMNKFSDTVKKRYYIEGSQP
jgi:hypothetical protein